jgi:very-long-chain enoyl-CoA reductase
MKWDSNEVVMLFLVWAFMEFCNFKCHLELASFRKNDKKGKGIPKKWGFKYVACANYLWETLGWLTFSILTKCYSSFAFTAVSAAQMVDWALKKHKAYKK